MLWRSRVGTVKANKVYVKKRIAMYGELKIPHMYTPLGPIPIGDPIVFTVTL